MSWSILKTENMDYSTGVSWDVVWEDKDGYIHLAECGREEDAKIIAETLTKVGIVPDIKNMKYGHGWKIKGGKKRC